MDPVKRILTSLVSTSQGIQTIAAQYANAKDVRQVRGHSLIRLEMELQAIAAACRAILEILSNPFLSCQYMLDDRLMGWLSDAEPQTCLAALNEMQDLLKLDRRVHQFNPTEFASPEDEVFEAVITLFHSRKAHFHFLLSGDIWNYETVALKQNLLMNVDSDNTIGEIPQDQRRRRSIAMNYVMSEGEGRRKREAVSQKLDRFLHFLDALDCTAKQKETAALRQLDTCTWLRSTGEYKSWRGGNDSFLLLQGKAGAGKTVLVSAVIEDMLETKHKEEFLAYFYCDFRTKRSTSAVEVMRSILAQLVGHLCAVMVEPEDLLNDLLKETNNRVESFYNAKGLSRYLSKVAQLCPQKPLIVVDALDECREMETLLDGLIMCKGDVRTFVTSRPLQNVIAMLSQLPSISMDRMAHVLSADILLHVTRELDSRCRLRTFEESLKEEIRSKLCAKADGMFRWVQCQIDTLDKCTSVSEIRRALESLPEGLEETYRRILLAIDRRVYDARRVRRALVWLVTALRPLRMDELLEGIMIDPDYRALDSRFGLIKGADLLELCRSLVVHHEETDIITLSHMSVKEYLAGELVCVKLPWYHIVMEGAHEQLARLCMAYIAMCLEEMKESRDRSSGVAWKRHIILTTPQGSRPLLKYVLSYGFSHLSHLGMDNAGIFKDIENLQVVIRQRNWEWDQVCGLAPSVRSGVPWPTSEHDVTIYTLIAFGSEALFRTFVRRTALTPREGTSPLVYAACFGKTEHARLLISQGVDINLRGLIVVAMVTDYSDTDAMDVDELDQSGPDPDISHAGDVVNCKAIPLEVAVDHWHAETVDLLLAQGSIVPDRLLARVLGEQANDFPLYIINRLLQTAEFTKWAVTPWENRGLLEALVDDAEDHGQVDGREELVLASRRLVEVGCAETLLILAVEKGCSSFVEALLSLNIPPTSDLSSTLHTHAIVNALAANGDTPLHVAMRLSVENQCLIITKLLVEAGCSPCQRDADDKPPVHIAVLRGFISVVEYLLSQDVPLPPRILFAALQVTPTLKRVNMIRLLISKGANVHAFSAEGNLLLHVAVRSPDTSVFPEIVQILIDAGCNPSARNIHGETPFQIAAKQEYSEAVKYLLLFDTSSGIMSSLGPDPSIEAMLLRSLVYDVDSLSMLPAGANRLLQSIEQYLDDEDKHLALAKRFLAAQDWGYAKLLHSAVRRGFYRVVEYLLSHSLPLPRGILFTALRHQVSMIPFLVRKGADLHPKRKNGDTLLHVAMEIVPEEAQCLATIQVLVEAGCHSSMPNANGEWPIHVAVFKGLLSVVEYLWSLAPHELPPSFLSHGSPFRKYSSMVRLLVDPNPASRSRLGLWARQRARRREKLQAIAIAKKRRTIRGLQTSPT